MADIECDDRDTWEGHTLQDIVNKCKQQNISQKMQSGWESITWEDLVTAKNEKNQAAVTMYKLMNDNRFNK